MGLEQASDLQKQIDARKKEASGKAELRPAWEGLEKKLEAATEADSDGGFGVFGVAAPGKEREPLPRGVAAPSRLLVGVGRSDLGAGGGWAMGSEGGGESAEETLAQWETFKKQDMATVNALLEKAKLKPLIVEESPAPH